MVQLAGELFAQKGYRATTVREIADAAGILSGSLYHHFDSKESIGHEILSASHRRAGRLPGRGGLGRLPPGGTRADRPVDQPDPGPAPPRAGHAAERLELLQRPAPVRVPAQGGGRDRADLGHQSERGKREGTFRADLDARLTYRLLRDVLWIPSQWRLAEGYSTEQVADALLRLLFDGITANG